MGLYLNKTVIIGQLFTLKSRTGHICNKVQAIFKRIKMSGHIFNYNLPPEVYTLYKFAETRPKSDIIYI